MRRIVSVLVAHPASCIAVVLAITLAFATQIPGLKVNVSPRMLMVGSDPAVAYYEAAMERFGTDEITIVVVKADDVFTTAVLESIDRLSGAARDIAEVTKVDSLTTVDDIRGEGDWVSTKPLVPGAIPKDPAALEKIRKSALRNPVMVGNVVAPDAKTAAVVIYSAGDPNDPKFNARFSNEIDAIVEAEHGRSGLDMYQIGKPYRQAMLAKTLIEDQEIIWPLALLIITTVVVFMLRAPMAVLILMVARLTCVVWAVGMMGLFEFPVTMLSSLIPLLLMSVGFTEDVYLVAEFYNCLGHNRGDKGAAIRETMAELATPLLVTSATTAVGFASLSLSDVTVLKQVGYLAPLAFVGSFLITLLLVPALLYYAPVPKQHARGEGEFSRRLTDFLVRVGRASVQNRRRTLLIAAAVFMLFATGLPRLHVDNDILGFFRQGSEIRQRAEDIHDRLAGALVFYLVVETKREGGAIEPETLRAIEGLQQFVAKTERIDETYAITDFLKTINREMHGGDEKFFTLPDSKELAAQYLVLLHENETEKYIDSDYAAANVVVRHDITSTRKTAEFIDQLATYAREHMPGLEVHPTAETILTTRAANVLSVNMLQDLGVTILIVGMVCSLFFMSLRAGLMSLIPNVLPVAIGFGTLGLFGVPINVGTSLIAAIAIGIAIDDTVHYMARNSMELDRHHDPVAAMAATVRAEGPAIVTTAFALAGGFLVLVQSSFMPLVHFGAVSAVTMLIALVCDLTITPALMASTRLVTLFHVVGTKLAGNICEIAPLFKDFTPWEAKKVVLLGKLRSFESESHVIRKGDASDRAMYMVLTGRVRVMDGADGSRTVLRHHSPGEIFGEMALIDGRERSADVIAEEATEILTLRSEDLDWLAKRFPRTALKLFQNLSVVLSDRIRSLTVALRSTRA